MLKIWKIRAQNADGTVELSLFGERADLMRHLNEAGYQVLAIEYDTWVRA